MSSLASRAEVEKLARELSVEPAEFAFLRDTPADALRTFRRAVVVQLDAPYRHMFKTVAAASNLVPNPISVKIATRYFGPLLCAKVAIELSPDRAAKLIGHVPVDFLADITRYIDPESATGLIRGLKTDIMVPTMMELLRRKDYVTLAKFISAVTDEQLLTVVPLVKSGEDLLMTAFNAEVMDRFEVVVKDLSSDRIKSIIQAAVDNDQFAETLTFLQHLSRPTLARVADAASDMGPEVVTDMVESAHREDAWAELVPVVSAMSEENLKTQANLEVWDAEKLTAGLRAAQADNLWEHVRPLVKAMNDDGIRRVRALPIVAEPDVQAAIGDLLVDQS